MEKHIRLHVVLSSGKDRQDAHDEAVWVMMRCDGVETSSYVVLIPVMAKQGRQIPRALRSVQARQQPVKPKLAFVEMLSELKFGPASLQASVSPASQYALM